MPRAGYVGCYFNKFFLHGIRWLPAVVSGLPGLQRGSG